MSELDADTQHDEIAATPTSSVMTEPEAGAPREAEAQAAPEAEAQPETETQAAPELEAAPGTVEIEAEPDASPVVEPAG